MHNIYWDMLYLYLLNVINLNQDNFACKTILLACGEEKRGEEMGEERRGEEKGGGKKLVKSETKFN